MPAQVNEASQALAFLVFNSNNALFAAQPAVAPNGTLTYTPAPDTNGTASVIVTLRDNGGTANGGVDTSPPQMLIINVRPMIFIVNSTRDDPDADSSDLLCATLSGECTLVQLSSRLMLLEPVLPRLHSTSQVKVHILSSRQPRYQQFLYRTLLQRILK